MATLLQNPASTILRPEIYRSKKCLSASLNTTQSSMKQYVGLREAGNFVFQRKTRLCNSSGYQTKKSFGKQYSRSVRCAHQALDVKPRVDEELVEKCINSIRMLVVDSVNNAKAGHPGAAMGLAPVGYVLWDEAMRYNPSNPHWFNRDRFVLSCGHAVLLQYVLLHLTGFDMQIEDLKNLVKLDSRTPGHPENMITDGIEVVTGPLGQGFANSVGLALAERHLSSRFNKPDFAVVDHYTYVIFGDGCAMEGVSNEAASLAGHWGLGKLIAFYDDNHNTIDGGTNLAFSEDVVGRYKALGWHTQSISLKDYGNPEVLRDAISEAKKASDRPSLIRVETVIGYGDPSKEGTSKAHHGAFGEEEGQKIREHLKWPHKDPFYVPPEVYGEMKKQISRGAEAENEWNELVKQYEKKYPKEAEEFHKCVSKTLPPDWDKALPRWKSDDKPDATRGYSEVVLNSIAGVIPGLVGGSADLASSNKVYLKDSVDFQKDSPWGRNVRYGVREHAMGSISNGMALHNSGIIPFAATFLVFTDYMRAAIRLSAISHAHVVYIMTHDSIGLGEDGPTHQPVEHLASLRAMPNLNVFRPGDGNEVSGAYKAAIERDDGPTLVALSRQKLEAQLEGSSIEGTLKGAYVLTDNSEGEDPDLIILGTGSELQLVQHAAYQLRDEGKKIRVVSFPSWEMFEEQPEEYREQILPPHVTARLAVEAGHPQGWREWVGPKGQVLGVKKFGKSAAYLDVFKSFGFTVENILAVAKNVMDTQ